MNVRKQWAHWAGQYAARAPREKLILLAAALAVVYAVLDAVLLTPALNARSMAAKSLEQRQAEVAQLSQQTQALTEQTRAQLQQTQAAIELMRRDLAQAGQELAEFERTLVAAERMPDFLKGLLPDQGIEVVSLRTLAPEALTVPQAAGGADSAKEPGEAPASGSEPASQLYKHGVEIRLAGSYPMLAAYLARMEKAPQKVLWGRMALAADQYPRTELTLVIYTLSLDRSWLAV